VKTTAIVRFDGTCLIIHEGLTHSFETQEQMGKWMKDMDITIEVSHEHPASGLRVNNGRTNHGEI